MSKQPERLGDAPIQTGLRERMAMPRKNQPSRQLEYKQLAARVQTLEDIVGYFQDRLKKIRERIKALETKHGGNSGRT